MKIPLLGGAYVARSVIAECQRCVNLYPENNPGDAEVPVTHYPTPGLTLLLEGPQKSPWRGIYLANNGVLYGVLGTFFYRINNDWTLQLLGTLVTNRTTPVSMVDNGTTLVLVDGSPQGYQLTLATEVFAQITDPNFVGGDYVGYVDTYFVLNVPGTNRWYCSTSGAVTFLPLYFGAKAGNADPVQSIFVIHEEVWLLGTNTTEVWAASGGAAFPFAKIPGVFIQHGTVAKYSMASWGLQSFWLSQDNKGQALIMMGQSYRAQPISTPAMVQEISKYATISDAIGMVYQQQGHVFYILTFPSANKTWCYDLMTQMWHERTWTDQNGAENRHRANCAAFAYGRTIVGDWQNGNLYELHLTEYTDNGSPIVRRRGFPHMVNEGVRINYISFTADMESGDYQDAEGQEHGDENSVPASVDYDPKISLRWSDTRGKSWGNPIMQSMGKPGHPEVFPTWRRLGYARDRVFELFWSEPVPSALNGAYLEVNNEVRPRLKPNG